MTDEQEIVAWLRRQADLGANRGNEAPKGSGKRAAFGGGSLALSRAADAIEAGEYRVNDNARATSPATLQVPKWATDETDPTGELAIKLAARAAACEEQGGEWTWRDIAAAAVPAHPADMRENVAVIIAQATGTFALDQYPSWAMDAADALARASLLATSAIDGREVTERAASLLETAIGDGYPAPANKVDQCEHGKFGWEDCIACYDDVLTGVVAAIRALGNSGQVA